jgi:disulfide bond formation protein DsbB
MNMVAVTPRKAFLGIFVIAALMMGYALFAEHVQGYQPCMLCMVQRVFVCLVGGVALLAFLHGPGVVGRRIYGALCALACAGGGVF